MPSSPIRFEPCARDDIGAYAAYLRSLSSPIDSFLEDHILASGFQRISEGGRELGFFATHPTGLLTQFHLIPAARRRAQAVYADILNATRPAAAFVPTCDEFFLSHALDACSDVQKQAYFFTAIPGDDAAAGIRGDLDFKVATASCLTEIAAVSGDFLDDLAGRVGAGRLECPSMSARTVLFVHGMYMTPLCWEGWIDRFQAKGYACLAPAWPGRDAPVAALRKAHPDPKLGALTLRDVIAGFVEVIQALPAKPIVIGHSMGGLVTQILAARGLAAAAIAIDSAPPQGVFSAEWSFIKSNFPHINPFAAQGRPIEMTFERFQYAFVNGMSLDEQRAAFERYVVPESRRVPAESLSGAARVDFNRPGPPLLLIAGERDHIIPASLTRANYKRYQRPDSRTDLLSLAGRNHFLLGQPGWEAVADASADWLEALATPPVGSSA